MSQAPSARDIVALLFATSHQLCLRSDRLLGATLGLSEGRARLLVAVSEFEPARMGLLARQLGVTARSVTGMVDALERDGLLVRDPDPEDRRATLLRLTSHGRALIDRLLDAQHRSADEMLGALSSQDKHELFRLLTEVHKRADG
ncbi:MarR family winged helix-turn-helix transcriptional regulator [Amycolatopsis suaedae]|uniref:MarR family transcriptional regulator n=1 Tax=Amycolatopsis suaedae TaxID=2510978 RepID=A0A4Q7JEX7_9PSEU|nr:MarR family transcriptional regulator [Amycolatopsis suaedae]RZQ66037.1 MarR family transcriptional regulator [Amycolatopsis suaedae]